MYCVRNVTSDLYWVGANDHRLALFENCFPIPRGVSYNAYCLLDEKTVLFDTVDWSACRQLLENLNHVLAGRELDYLLINHLEPDHAACIEEILLRHPKVKVISNEKAFMLMRQFGFHVDDHECIEVKEGDTFSFGRHTVTFVGAPMVHWPEAMVTFGLIVTTLLKMSVSYLVKLLKRLWVIKQVSTVMERLSYPWMKPSEWQA